MELCHDYGDNPACLKEADPRYRMDYTDVKGGAVMHWCAHCGPVAHAMEAAVNRAFEERPGFREEFREAIERAMAERPTQ